jgi:hypothetical protein
VIQRQESRWAHKAMTKARLPRVRYVIGPCGSAFTIADLPASGTERWVIRCKAEVVAAVRGGLLSLEQACSRYALSAEEFLSWQRSVDQHGLAGLRTTRIQQYARSFLPVPSIGHHLRMDKLRWFRPLRLREP